MSKPASSNLTLKIVKKDKNSPLLSIQNFIQRNLLHQQPVEIKHLWNKYKMIDAHSLLIKNHQLDYQIFRELAEIILEIYQPYHLDLQPGQYKKTVHVTADDLIPREC